MTVAKLRDRPTVLTPDMAMESRTMGGAAFYAALERDFDGFRNHALISEYGFSEDWPSWERHPKGDEFIYLISGAASFVCLDEDGAETVTRLDTPGQYVVIPRGAWHTARTSVPTRALFVTPGEGTEHADDPPAELPNARRR